MAYERQYYTNGDVLDARQMNHMETGIKENSDNIDKHSEDIATKASAIKEKASGEVLVVTDSDEAKPLGLAIDGKSEQNQYSGKNFLPNKGTTQTIDGVSFDVNDNGIVILNGTATKDITFYIATKATVGGILAETGSYVLNGCPSGGSEQTYRLAMWGKNENGGFSYDYGNGANVEFTNVSGNYNVVINITSGYTANNLVFKPMFSVEGGEYEPYCGGKPSPSPEYKQEIRNIGVYDEASGKYSVGIVGTKKNKLNSKKLKEQTMNGITYTPVKDENGLLEYVEVNGAATKTSSYEILTDLKKGKYILNGCPSGGETSTYTIQCKKNNTSGYAFGEDRGLNGLKFVLDEETTIDAYIRIGSGTVCNGLRFYPMIRLEEISDDTYEPYKETTATVLLDEPLRKGDKAYWNGGSKVRVDRYRAVEVFDGSDDETLLVQSEKLWYSTKKLNTIARDFSFVCNSYRNTGNTINDGYNAYINGSNEPVFYDTRFTNANDLRTWLQSNPVEFEYQLAKPITEEIDIDLGELSMFYPTTVISNDCNANMEVTYIADTKAYIDKLKAKHESDITALKTAIVALGGTV